MNFNKVIEFYEKQYNGKCHFVKRGMECQKRTTTLFCDEHQKYKIDADVAIKFLETLTSHPEKLHSILNSGKFFATHKNCHDHDCNSSDCYSGDTEFEYNTNLTETVKDLFQYDDEAEEDEEMGMVYLSETQVFELSINPPNKTSLVLPTIPTITLPNHPVCSKPEPTLKIVPVEGEENTYRVLEYNYIIKIHPEFNS